MEVSDVEKLFSLMSEEISKVVVGKKDVLKLMFVALTSGGHVLLEGVPGIAKTLMAKAFSRSLDLSFKRIQFTPDMLPSDVMGTFVFNQRTQDFVFRKGPIFANLVLGDEINRATPRTQSAVLEAMQERQVTVEGFTNKLEEPFMVVATQNPIEREGTYPLPEAQLDRFMFRIIVDYPDHEEGIKVLKSSMSGADVNLVQKVVDARRILGTRDLIRRNVYVAEEILEYTLSIVEATRQDSSRVTLGGSPRAAVHLLEGARALAAVDGRDYVVPDDVKELAFHVLNHRILLKPEYVMRLDDLNKPVNYERLRLVVSEALSNISPPR